MNIIKSICYIFVIVHFNLMNIYYRKWTLQNKNLNSLFQNYNLTYFSKHLEYKSHTISLKKISLTCRHAQGAQWLSGRVLDSRPRGRGFVPHWRHFVVVLEQDTFILA